MSKFKLFIKPLLITSFIFAPTAVLAHEEGSLWHSVKDFFNRSTDTVQEDATDLSKGIKEGSKKVWASTKETSVELWDDTADAREDTKQVGEEVANSAVDLFNSAKNAVSEVVED